MYVCILLLSLCQIMNTVIILNDVHTQFCLAKKTNFLQSFEMTALLGSLPLPDCFNRILFVLLPVMCTINMYIHVHTWLVDIKSFLCMNVTDRVK